MNEKMNVAEAKKKFSELLSRTAYNGERFIINRRGGSVLVKRGDPGIELVFVDSGWRRHDCDSLCHNEP